MLSSSLDMKLLVGVDILFDDSVPIFHVVLWLRSIGHLCFANIFHYASICYPHLSPCRFNCHISYLLDPILQLLILPSNFLFTFSYSVTNYEKYSEQSHHFKLVKKWSYRAWFSSITSSLKNGHTEHGFLLLQAR